MQNGGVSTTTIHNSTPTPAELHIEWAIAFQNYQRLLAAPCGNDYRNQLDRAFERLDRLSRLLDQENATA